MDVYIPELVSIEEYDSYQAKLEASIKWILAKAGEGVDNEEDAYPPRSCLSTSVVESLTSGDIYCRAMIFMFPDSTKYVKQGHVGIIQWLLRRGIDIEDIDGCELTEILLRQTNPFQKYKVKHCKQISQDVSSSNKNRLGPRRFYYASSAVWNSLPADMCDPGLSLHSFRTKLKSHFFTMAHMSFIDAIMTAFVLSILSVEKVVQAVRRFATFSVSSELPMTVEDTVIFWVNKSCSAFVGQCKLPTSTSVSGLQIGEFNDIGDGRCLAALISFYYPLILPNDAIALSDSLGIADCLYNLQLVYEFCTEQLPVCILHMTVNDLFHLPSNLRTNILTFFADLFECVELNRSEPSRTSSHSDVVQRIDQRTPEQNKQQQSNRRPPLIPQISETTKRSFQQPSPAAIVSNQKPSHSSGLSLKEVLLPRRNIDNSSSDTQLEAWSEHQPHRIPAALENYKAGNESERSTATSLLSNVSMDASLVFDTAEDSIDLTTFENKRDLLTNRTMTLDGCDTDRSTRSDVIRPNIVQTWTAGQAASSNGAYDSRSGSLLSDYLVPAHMRPAKEKANCHTKDSEYGEQKTRKKQKFPNPSQDGTGETGSNHSSNSSTPSDGYKTPSVEAASLHGSLSAQKICNLEEEGYVMNDNKNLDQDCVFDNGSFDRNRLGGQSFVVRGRPVVAEEARAAGIPVVNDEMKKVRPLSMSSAGRDSSDGPDQELMKLHSDFRDKESRGTAFVVDVGKRESGFSMPLSFGQRKGSEGVLPEKTSFAQIRKEKEMEALIGDSAADFEKMDGGSRTKTTFPKSGKKTTFGMLPNQTTWAQACIQRSASEVVVGRGKEDSAEPLPSELMNLRLRLDEKRKQIENEKRRAERQWTRHRQQVGNEAFIQVITKSKSASTSQTDENKLENPGSTGSLNRPKPVDSSNHADIQAKLDRVLTDRTRSIADNRTENSGKPIINNDVRKVTTKEQREKSQIAEINSPRQPVEPKSEENGNRVSTGQFNTSLDMLNSSVSELQGEIKRLTKEQNKIKHYVQTDLERGASSNQDRAPSTGPVNDQFYLFNQSSHSDPGKPSGYEKSPQPYHTPVPVQQPRPSLVPYSSPSYPPLSTSFPNRFNPATLPYPANSYQPYIPQPHGSLPADRIYSTPPQFMMGQNVHGYQNVPGMYPMSTPLQYNNPWQMTPNQQQSYPSHVQQPNMSAMQHDPRNYHEGVYPMGMQSSPAAMLQNINAPMSQMQMAAHFPNQTTVPMGYHLSNASASAVGLPLMHGVVPTMTDTPHHASIPTNVGVNQPLTAIGANQIPNAIEGNPISVGANQLHAIEDNETSSQPAQSASHSLADEPTRLPSPRHSSDHIDIDETDQHDDISIVEDVPEIRRQSAGQGEGFFIQLDSTDPLKKSKPPKMPLRGAKVDELISSPAPAVVSSSSPVEQQCDAERQTATEKEHIETPVVFVVGQSSTELPDPTEMERKKQKLAELQAKRREEQELRRLKLEMEQHQKREAQRHKQEEAEQKKAEDKARREAIFQTYLHRKLEVDGMDDEIKPTPPVIRRQKNSRLKSSRPKSQPPPASDAGSYEVPSITHGHPSQDNLTSFGLGGAMNYTACSVERINTLTSRIDQPMSDLSSGNSTGRLPTPDRVVKFAPVPPLNEVGMSDGNQLDYAGPKLFVKPSQKSNRTIIINAISHCCLAGIVNKDVKNKVLEEIMKSESKHFIILFRDAGMQYRGLYTYNPEQEEVLKIHGVGPKQLADKYMDKFYKYNSGAKNFSEVTSTKHLSATIDAVSAVSTVWQKTRAPPAASTPTSKRQT